MTTPLPNPILSLQSFGAVTHLGNSARQTVASWIAQSRRQHRVKLEGFADPFTLADRPDLTESLHGPQRLFALLASALAEALDHLPYPDALTALSDSLNLLVLPQWFDEKAQQSLLEAMAGLWPDREIVFSPITGDATAAWEALDSAYRVLEANPKIDQVVMLCVDSLCDPTPLYQAAEAQRLLQKNNSEGYVPGEAAVCLVLKRVRDVSQLPAGQFALHRPVLARQADPWWPSAHRPDPKPLITALSGALNQAGLSPNQISHLLSDMDGSSWRAQLEARALGRTIFSQTSERPHWRPATLFGQIGTATGALGWILAALMHNHRIAPLNTLLNWSIDPAGGAAACVMERSPKID
jgi:3-oxoacyl-[acyl-carrier-protein] synthase I